MTIDSTTLNMFLDDLTFFVRGGSDILGEIRAPRYSAIACLSYSFPLHPTTLELYRLIMMRHEAPLRMLGTIPPAAHKIGKMLFYYRPNQFIAKDWEQFIVRFK